MNRVNRRSSALSVAHVHALTLDVRGRGGIATTHEGIYDISIASDGAATGTGPRAGLDVDPRGFVTAGGTTYVLGHYPGATYLAQTIEGSRSRTMTVQPARL